MKKPLVDFEAFLMGVKPALYGTTASPNYMANFHLLERYPCVTKGISQHNDADFFLFFQTESMKKDFLEKLARVEHLSPEFHELLGITLGYPPLAVKNFVECRRLEEVEKRINDYKELLRHKVSFIYSGIRCGGHVNDIVENSVWLWEQYYIKDEPFKIGMIEGDVMKYYEVKPYDFDELERVKQRKLELISRAKEEATL
ncbi:hypothetical protein [Laceyella tengchongensis]|uniref:Uncharacterized protein n=1 Tax=Laceyella tengchongensis TaxID=574699 RepID=A0AA45WJM4_9BACL|nr:hypothetical protein [Laceyella tengchongensis]MRG28073.1 hypothetical protein [Laceyella tengchongensis]SMP03829.1 hypothetical protein SAMN06265361_101486 [Laceyella tengchongensis]